MRELTKSTLSAGLAMSLFGMQTMMNAFRRSPDGGPNPAARRTRRGHPGDGRQTGDTLRETFQVGDKVQRDAGRPDVSVPDPRALAGGGRMSTLTDMARQATERARTLDGRHGRGPQTRLRLYGVPRGPHRRGPDPAIPAMDRAALGPGWGPMPNQP